MSFIYTHAKYMAARGELDFREAGADLRVALVMTNTTADTEKDVSFMGDFATLDEYDGSAYVRKVIPLQTVTQNDASDRADIDGSDIVFTGIGAGTRSAQAMIIFKFGTNDADSVPVAFIDTGGFPFNGNGGDVTVQWNAAGIIQVT